LSPAHVVTDSRYKVTLFFGDNGKQVMREPQKVHLYTKPGNYTYSILVEPSSQQPKPTPTPPIAIPNVKLTATPGSVEINQPVSLAAQLSHPYPNIQYRFVFGDGPGGNWQTEAKATHAYRAKGNYQAYVDLGVSANGSIKKAGESKRESIQVNEPARPPNVTAKLVASATSAKAGDSVTFVASTNPSLANGRYRFNFGDQSVNGWQARAQATHKYTAPGKYSARVEIQPTNRAAARTITSDPVSVEITPVEKLSVNLIVIPNSVPQGLPIFFSATAAGADSQARYRFDFGDSKSDWSSQSNQIHTYASAGDYVASVQMATSRGATVVSQTKLIRIIPIIPPPASPTPSPERSPTASPTGSSTASPTALPTGSQTPEPSGLPTALPLASTTPPGGGPTWLPDDWWKYLIILALVVFSVYKAASMLLVPRPTFVPHVDVGEANVGAGSLAIDLQVDVDPNVAGGEFTLNTEGGSLIKSARSE
jgi:PKD repeat protein